VTARGEARQPAIEKPVPANGSICRKIAVWSITRLATRNVRGFRELPVAEAVSCVAVETGMPGLCNDDCLEAQRQVEGAEVGIERCDAVEHVARHEANQIGVRKRGDGRRLLRWSAWIGEVDAQNGPPGHDHANFYLVNPQFIASSGRQLERGLP
jgi:hypothetical protein